MSYETSHRRSLQIVNRISNTEVKTRKSAEIEALIKLLQIDTTQPNDDFLRQFRELKKKHPFINDLCQRKGFFGSLAYAFRSDHYRAERYRTIVEQLKQGSYDDKKEKSSKLSYFANAPGVKKSVCEKVEDLKMDYLKRTYLAPTHKTYLKDKKEFDELTNFNENVSFKSSKALSLDIQTKENTDLSIWNEFIKVNPEYSVLDQNNQNSTMCNINGKPMQFLRQKVLKWLKLPENIPLFMDKGNLNESVGIAIKQQRQQAAIILQNHIRIFQQHLKNKIPNEYGVRELVYTKGGKKETFVFSKHLIGHKLPEANLKNGPAGGFKQIIGKNGGNVLFNQNKDPKPVIDCNEAEAILLKHNITSFKGATRISSTHYIAHNAGNNNLFTKICNYKSFEPSYFKQILNDMKKLHKAGYYHFDIKPANIQIGDKGPTVIDLDMFSSTEKFHGGCTHEYVDINILTLCKTLTLKKAELFRIRDEYALACTLIEANGIGLPDNNLNEILFRDGNMNINQKIRKFITTYVKPEHQQAFTALVRNPYSYFEKFPKNLHLADMFRDL